MTMSPIERLYNAIAESYAELSDEQLEQELAELTPAERAELQARGEQLRHRMFGMLYQHQRQHGDNHGARRTLQAMSEAPPGAAKGPA
jgi:hypothetical protein